MTRNNTVQVVEVNFKLRMGAALIAIQDSHPEKDLWFEGTSQLELVLRGPSSTLSKIHAVKWNNKSWEDHMDPPELKQLRSPRTAELRLTHSLPLHFSSLTGQNQIGSTSLRLKEPGIAVVPSRDKSRLVLRGLSGIVRMTGAQLSSTIWFNDSNGSRKFDKLPYLTAGVFDSTSMRWGNKQRRAIEGEFQFHDLELPLRS